MSERTIAVPARALTYAHDHGFVLMWNGVQWPYDYGPMTVTVPRPRDYAGGGVTVRLFFKCSPGPEGDHEFRVATATYNSGDEFETHGSKTTPLMDLPGVADTVYATSVVIPPGDGWGDGDWWYFQLIRHGLYRSHILMMSVGIDYEATPLLRRRPTPVRKVLKNAARTKASKVSKKKVSKKARRALTKSSQAKPRKARPARR